MHSAGVDVASHGDDEDDMTHEDVDRFPYMPAKQDKDQNNDEDISTSSAEASKDMELEDQKRADNNDKETEPEDDNETLVKNDKTSIENKGDEVVKPKNYEISTE